MTDTLEFPRGIERGAVIAPLASSYWFLPDALEKEAQNSESDFAYHKGKIWLGRTPTMAREPVGWMDDRHVVTIAGSRAGKGVSAIIPTLCEYPGSVICIDPKGENAFRTASRRGFGTSRIKGLRQDVYVLDPYGVSGVPGEYLATFDPLAGLSPDDEDTLEEAILIAEALIVSADQRDAHWDDSARALVEALILHVISAPEFEDDRTLGRVRLLLRDGDRVLFDALQADPEVGSDPLEGETPPATPFEALLWAMETNHAFDGLISGVAQGVRDLADRERASVLSTARRNLKFLDAPRMRRCLQSSDHTLSLEDLKRAPNGVSVYLVLPSRLMKAHSRWMRLMLSLTVARLERDDTAPATDHPVLAIVDEFPTLGPMPILEAAVGYMAGFGLKIWAILQDLSQLKRDYPKSWETFLGNAGLLQFFGNTDPTTLEFIAKRLGELEVLTEVVNQSDTETITVADISDFDKLRRMTEKKGLAGFFGSFALDENTKSSTKSGASGQTVSRSVQKTALMGPDEIRRHFARETQLQIIATAEHAALFVRRTPYYADPYFAGKYAEKR